jgi:hypothetical protein
MSKTSPLTASAARCTIHASTGKPEPMPSTFNTSSDVIQAQKLIGRIAKILAHNPARVQGAVLSDLLATWIGGHFVPGNRTQTDILRVGLLEEHVKLVVSLIHHNEPAMAKTEHPWGHA